jgi:hypothetical protein
VTTSTDIGKSNARCSTRLPVTTTGSSESALAAVDATEQQTAALKALAMAAAFEDERCCHEG